MLATTWAARLRTVKGISGMDLARALTIPVATAAVWRALGDRAVLCSCLQGCAVDDGGNGQWRVAIEPGHGAPPATFRVARASAATGDPYACTLEATGEGEAAGSGAAIDLRLAPAADGDGTEVRYSIRQRVDAGRDFPLLDARLAELADSFWQSLSERLLGPAAATEAEVAPASGGAGNPLVRYLAIAFIAALIAYLYARGLR